MLKELFQGFVETGPPLAFRVVWFQAYACFFDACFAS